MNRVIDISWPLFNGITGYKDKKSVIIHELKNFEKDGVRESMVELNCHAGTHIDAPSHFLRDGKPIERVVPVLHDALVLDMTMHPEKITRDCLMVHDADIMPDSAILLRTSNSLLSPIDPFNPQFVYLEASGAAYLAEKKVHYVGIDYLGIERDQPGHPTHKTLMNANITIIEGLRLEYAPPGKYLMICLPLYMIGVEAAPARAVLLGE